MVSSSNCWKYDVFLSFRGQETRNTFTAHLYHALCNKGINAFIDDKLERGEHITSKLDRVIEDSRISLLIFSENYARSIYCLDELVKILECKESKGQVVFPVFYNVDPSDVEEQNGSFGEALLFHETYWGIDTERVQKWREALTKAAQLSGWHLNNGNEAKFIWRIVEKVLSQLNHTSLHIAAYQVGLNNHIEEINHMLNTRSDGVCMVGLCGIGGVGKTTISKAVYNLIANQFEGSCFLSNVREISKQYGLLRLQETLLYEILGDKNLVLGSVDRGINVIRDRLRNKKVLIVIDDVDNLDQLKQLAGEPDWFGLGSRIIITTRDEHLLVAHGVERLYKVKELCPDDALMLFSWNAFRNPHPSEDHLEVSLRAVRYAQGLPLALVVLGSFLYGRSIREWESELDRLKRIPNKQIYEVLKISFDGLEYHEKTIFLDIACFFKGQEKDYVIKILDACDVNPDIGIQVLIEKSLIYIENNKIQMHELLQSMGRQIVHQESPNIPGRRSRLWFHEDVLHVLTENIVRSILVSSSFPNHGIEYKSKPLVPLEL